MASSVSPRGLLLGALGGLIGGVAGYYLFGLIWRWGFYGMIIPGAAVGVGVGRLSGERSTIYGVLAAVVGLCAGIYTEWDFRPFNADPSFSYFLVNVHKLTPVSQIMIVLGAVFAYWFGQGRDRFVKREAESDVAPPDAAGS